MKRNKNPIGRVNPQKRYLGKLNNFIIESVLAEVMQSKLRITVDHGYLL
jgi:hypothetical protein